MYGLALGRAGAEQPNSIQNAALGILRRYGTDAHVYLPGAGGVAISGLNSGNYTLSDGSTGYSAIDGTAGLVLDAAGSVGAELFTGAFTRYNTVESDTTTVPALCTSTGVFSVVGISKSATANMPYRCSVTWSGNTTGRTIQVGGGTGIAILGTAVSGSATFTVAPSNVSMYIYFTASAAGQAVSFDSFSARPISGIHATQSTTANKPAERRGLYNLAYPSDPAHTDWAKVGATPIAGGIQEDTSGSTHRTQRNVTIPAGAPVTARVKMLSTTRNAQLELGGGTGGASVTFGLSSSGSILVAAAPYGTGWTVQAASILLDPVDGYYECILSATPNSGVTSVVSYLYMMSGSSAAYTGNGTSTLLTKEFGLFAGTLTAAQILAEGGIPLTTSAAASNQSAGRYWGQFDGTNDSLYATTAPFNQNDDWFMCSAFRCDSAAAYNVALASAVDATSKGPKLLVLQTTGYAALEMSDGTTSFTVADTVSCLGQVVVIWATQVAGVRKLWKNGTLIGSNSTALSPTTCVGLRIGASGTGGGSPFSGMLGPQMAHKGTFSDADALTLARMVASNTPNGPTF